MKKHNFSKTKDLHNKTCFSFNIQIFKFESFGSGCSQSLITTWLHFWLSSWVHQSQAQCWMPWLPWLGQTCTMQCMVAKQPYSSTLGYQCPSQSSHHAPYLQLLLLMWWTPTRTIAVSASFNGSSGSMAGSIWNRFSLYSWNWFSLYSTILFTQ